jgi:decaprenylphospho-beta-D-erythro-pentofuranosid-2-ulose 2-reductase
MLLISLAGVTMNNTKVTGLKRVVLISGKSEIGLAILDNLPLFEIEEIIFVGRDLKAAIYRDRFINYNLVLIEHDFTHIAEVADIIEQIYSYGCIDLAIIATGVDGPTPGSETVEDIALVTSINFISPAAFVSGFAKRMVDVGTGRILIVSSLTSVRPHVQNFIYSSTKAGLDFFSRGYQNYLWKSGVTLTILRPGFVFTRLSKGKKPLPFALNAEAVGKIGATAVLAGKKIVYAPKFLNQVAKLLLTLPNFLFQRIGR